MDAQSIRPLFLVLQEFRTQWRNFPVTHMQVFLEVARNDLERHNWGVTEVGDRLDINQATASRIIVDLGDRSVPTGGNETLNLIKTIQDPLNSRKRIPVLTAKGKLVYEKIERLLNGQ